MIHEFENRMSHQTRIHFHVAVIPEIRFRDHVALEMRKQDPPAVSDYFCLASDWLSLPEFFNRYQKNIFNVSLKLREPTKFHF